MAGLYIHFPFCKQACHYCNFYFSTNPKNQNEILNSIKVELKLRKKELVGPIESIYFGGGSPSLIKPKVVEEIIKLISSHYQLAATVETTLEVNPDDVSKEYLKGLRTAGINRLSIGIQSFHDKELKMMNRAHNMNQALQSIVWISELFNNFSIDLIYGIPYSSLASWEDNILKALSFDPPHISSYALTVEPKTVLAHQIEKNTLDLLDEELVKDQYDLLLKKLEEKEYENYEFSNFGKPGFHSVNNSNYWNGKPYLGIGPAAHSFDGNKKRSWNISNSSLYLKSIKEGKLNNETELLSQVDLYNEYVMTGLRTILGISKKKVTNVFGTHFSDYLEKQADKYLITNKLYWDGDLLKITKKAKFLSDGIASDLFMLKA